MTVWDIPYYWAAMTGLFFVIGVFATIAHRIVFHGIFGSPPISWRAGLTLGLYGGILIGGITSLAGYAVMGSHQIAVMIIYSICLAASIWATSKTEPTGTNRTLHEAFQTLTTVFCYPTVVAWIRFIWW